jgi:hypothetical protein
LVSSKGSRGYGEVGRYGQTKTARADDHQSGHTVNTKKIFGKAAKN